MDDNYKLVVLISCMNESDISIIERSNVQSDVVVVNQCERNSVNEFDFTNRNGCICHAKFINSKERGLSRSRNMAIRNSWGDILYMCDDDEYLEDNYEDTIRNAYQLHPSCDVISFSLIRKGYNYPSTERTMDITQILRTSSVQTTFKRKSIFEHALSFDEKMGSGTGNGGGEENKFLMDCRRKGLRLFYTPEIIATVKSENSRWFSGFNEKYFKDTFWAARRILGPILGFIYLLYWCIIRSKNYHIDISKRKMIRSSITGFFEKR